MMNERIRELADQAGITTNLETDYFEKDINKWVDYYSEKFAKLIVRECIEQVITGPNGPAHYAVEAALRLKKHFGVEE
jgi:hypothetical protein